METSRGGISDIELWWGMRPGVRETIYQISYWLLPRNKMETGWEPGQEASRPVTWDKMISSCPRFLMRIKRSIKGLGGLWALKSLGGSFQKLLELHQMLGRGCSAPPPHPRCKMLFSAPALRLGWWWQHLLGCSIVYVKPCCPQSRLHASRSGGRRAQKQEERLCWFSVW